MRVLVHACAHVQWVLSCTLSPSLTFDVQALFSLLQLPGGKGAPTPTAGLGEMIPSVSLVLCP